ncbi:PAS domain-containing protein, partial [Streptomyces flaveolus]|uniref:PAS domain-containing protein n=1 Tax=Streptomyces flaveolus TaxID=67297 RepID=UPI0034229308
MASGTVLVRIAGDGRIVEWSARAEALLGRTRSEAEGRTLGALLNSAPLITEVLDEVSARPVVSGTELTWEVREGRAAGDALRDQAVLRALFTHAPIDLYVLDRDLRVLGSPDGLGGAAASDIAPGAPDFPTALGLEDPERERAVARRVLDTGEPVLQRLVRAAPAGGTGRPVDQ